MRAADNTPATLTHRITTTADADLTTPQSIHRSQSLLSGSIPLSFPLIIALVLNELLARVSYLSFYLQFSCRTCLLFTYLQPSIFREGEPEVEGKAARAQARACWDCGSPDHFRNKCPKSSKSSSSDKGKGGTANAAIESDSDYEGEGAFAAHSVDGYTSDDDASLPELQTVSDSSDGSDRGEGDADGDADGEESGSDWFSEVSDDDLGSLWGDDDDGLGMISTR
ncbi:hypothetical protein D9615_010728 [Tricholomella constricta]|uniref:CCHC-type domain-containing protein n=1 Tax=Tricholomella constricta TaxID=117010 RepID=A0A8H5LPT2_9AGAR|nr:hypothetical protein D9615_010728 [Tricholomella constricta]